MSENTKKTLSLSGVLLCDDINTKELASLTAL